MMDHVSPIRLTVPKLNLELILINTSMYFGLSLSWLHCSYLYVSKTNGLGWEDILTMWLKNTENNISLSLGYLNVIHAPSQINFTDTDFTHAHYFLRLNQNGKHKCFYETVISIICYSLCCSLLLVMKITSVPHWIS